MDVRSLILDDTEEADVEEKTEKSARKKNMAKLEAVLNDGCDLAIRRTTPKTSKLLVLLVSQEQYYVKDERGGNILRITPWEGGAAAARLAGFFKQTGGIADGSIPGSWLYSMESGIAAAKNLVHYLDRVHRSSSMADMVRRGWGFFDGNTHRQYFWESTMIRYDYTAEERRFIWDGKRPLCEHVFRTVEERTGMPLQRTIGSRTTRDQHNKWLNLLDSIPELARWHDAFSLESARELVDRWAETPFTSLLEKTEEMMFKEFLETARNPGRTIEYLLGLQETEGYGDNLGAAIRLLNDTRHCQRQAYGRIVEKYPENLATFHNRVAYLARQREEADQREAFDSIAPKLAEREWSSEPRGWAIVAPKTVDDVYDEAAQQHNCVAGYIQSICNGDTQVYFLRKASALAKSAVTVQVTGNRVVQAKRACNKAIGPAERSALESWADVMGLTIARFL